MHIGDHSHAFAAPRAPPPCGRALSAASGRRLTPVVALTPNAQSAQRQENFGTSRGTKYLRDVRFTAEPPLPKTLTPAQLNFEALISRTGDNLESTDFPDPTFTQPRISEDRKSVTFTICLNATGIDAGKYVGSVTAAGPPGLAPGTINLTVNAKEGSLFLIGAIVTFVLCLLLLLAKDAAAHFKKPGDNWWEALRLPLVDLRWWGATLVALGAAFGALYLAYANDPVWGANGLGAVIALIGSGVTAIGGKSVLSAFAKPSDQ
jgi:hypothetical protein